MDDVQLIRDAVRASGLSARQFAELVMTRDERTIRRWLAGQDLPAIARRRLEWFLRLPEPRRRQLVKLVTVK